MKKQWSPQPTEYHFPRSLSVEVQCTGHPAHSANVKVVTLEDGEEGDRRPISLTFGLGAHGTVTIGFWNRDDYREFLREMLKPVTVEW